MHWECIGGEKVSQLDEEGEPQIKKGPHRMLDAVLEVAGGAWMLAVIG